MDVFSKLFWEDILNNPNTLFSLVVNYVYCSGMQPASPFGRGQGEGFIEDCFDGISASILTRSREGDIAVIYSLWYSQKHMKDVRKSELMLIFITVIWGGTFVSIKVALSYTSPLLLMAMRFFSAFLFFIMINRINILKISRKSLLYGSLLGLLMFLGYGLQTIGLKFTSASRSGFITYFYALLTPFFQFLILKRRPFWGTSPDCSWRLPVYT